MVTLAKATETELHYTPRTDHLPPRGQTWLYVAGVRPDYGPCPGCSAPEANYCARTCTMTDPYALLNLTEVRRCTACEGSAQRPTLSMHAGLADVLVVPRRPVRHLLHDTLPQTSLCRRVRASHQAAVYRGVEW